MSVRGAACKECAWASAGERALGSSSVNGELERASRSLCGEPCMAGLCPGMGEQSVRAVRVKENDEACVGERMWGNRGGA